MEILHELKNVTLKNLADKLKDVEQVDEMSPYTEIFGGKKRIIIKKNLLFGYCEILQKNYVVTLYSESKHIKMSQKKI